MKKMFVVLAIASSFAFAPARCGAEIITENFSSNPMQNGWQVFGNTNLFVWTNQNLDVTWDSSQPNSYFFHPLGQTVTRNDDFSISFDLFLNDIASGNEPGKTGPMELGFGLLNFDPANTNNATTTNFMRGAYGSAPNVAEFDYYPHGYYTSPFYDAPPTTVPAFISGVDSFDYAPQDLSPYDNELPTNQWVHVALTYTATNQSAVLIVTTNGIPIGNLPPLALDGGNGFPGPSDDFTVDTFSISSYSSAGDDFDSVLAHGSIANITVTIPPPAQNLSVASSNGVAQVQFTDPLGWNYTLQRATDLVSWTNVSAAVAGNGTNLFLLDTNPPTANAFYRIKAERP